MAASLAERLGYGPDDRLVILHVDDVGLCPGSNQAFLELSAAGLARSGSIMVPCPAAGEIIETCAGRDDLDVGVHLTLTAEWPTVRWGPLTTRDPASGLVNAVGTMWASVPQLLSAVQPESAAAELRAQIERMTLAGVKITHLDTHMGACIIPPLVDIYADLGRDFRVPIMAVQSEVFNAPHERQLLGRMDEYGLPPVDSIRVTPCYSGFAGQNPTADLYERILGELEPGVTHFALHPNAPGDIEWIDPVHHAWRIFEYHYLQSDRLDAFLRREGITPIGYRALYDRMVGAAG
jgi:predicted glycoside hydrolase/deacetylase ChbG (UPF0249 family)